MQRRRIKKNTIGAALPLAQPPQQEDPVDAQLEQDAWQEWCDFWRRWCPKVERGKVVDCDVSALYAKATVQNLLSMILFWKCLPLHMESRLRLRFPDAKSAADEAEQQRMTAAYPVCYADRAIEFLALAAEARGLDSESIRHAHAVYRGRLMDARDWLRDRPSEVSPGVPADRPDVTPENVLGVVPSRQRLSDADRAGYAAGLKEIGRLATRLLADLIVEQPDLAIVRKKNPGRKKHRRPVSVDLSIEDRALAVLVKHSDWPTTKIAQTVGCNRRSLYRKKRFMEARDVLKMGKQELPHGPTKSDPESDDPNDRFRD